MRKKSEIIFIIAVIRKEKWYNEYSFNAKTFLQYILFQTDFHMDQEKLAWKE